MIIISKIIEKYIEENTHLSVKTLKQEIINKFTTIVDLNTLEEIKNKYKPL